MTLEFGGFSGNDERGRRSFYDIEKGIQGEGLAYHGGKAHPYLKINATVHGVAVDIPDQDGDPGETAQLMLSDSALSWAAHLAMHVASNS